MTDNKTNSYMAIAVILGVILVIGGGIFFLSAMNKSNTPNTTTPTATPTGSNPATPSETPATPETKFTADELAKYDGKNGNKCYVAISGTVYEINSNEWQDGEHTPSMGQATCGRDLTSVLSQSPHGTTVLRAPAATAVGTF